MFSGQARPGDRVRDPRSGRTGRVIDIQTNPACLLRELTIDLGDGRCDEWQELDVVLLEPAAEEDPRPD